LLTTYTQTLSNAEELPLQNKTILNTAKLKLEENKHLIIEELVSVETETIIDEKQPFKCNIKTTVLELLPIESNETITETKPTELNIIKANKHKAKQVNQRENKSIKITEDVELQTVTEIKKEVMDKYRALITDTTKSTGKIKYYIVLIVKLG